MQPYFLGSVQAGILLNRLSIHQIKVSRGCDLPTRYCPRFHFGHHSGRIDNKLAKLTVHFFSTAKHDAETRVSVRTGITCTAHTSVYLLCAPLSTPPPTFLFLSSGSIHCFFLCNNTSILLKPWTLCTLNHFITCTTLSP